MKLSERLAHLAVTLPRISDDDMEALNEAATLARRVEEAPVRIVRASGVTAESIGGRVSAPAEYIGQRVAIVPVDDGAGERGVAGG